MASMCEMNDFEHLEVSGSNMIFVTSHRNTVDVSISRFLLHGISSNLLQRLTESLSTLI